METITKAKFLNIIEPKIKILYPTQTKLSLPILNRIYQKMKIGLEFQAIKIHELFICDGHHRYVASVCCGKEIGEEKSTLSSSSYSINWGDVDFVDEDWDTPFQVLKYNLSDASFNNIPLSELNKLME